MPEERSRFEEIHTYRTEGGDCSENLMVFLDELREHLDKAPVEHRCNVTIQLASCTDYDGYPEARATIGYNRPLTPEEIDNSWQTEKRDIAWRYQSLIDTAMKLKADAEKHGVPLDKLGLSSTPNYIELRR